jgi:hypothetical protein
MQNHAHHHHFVVCKNFISLLLGALFNEIFPLLERGELLQISLFYKCQSIHNIEYTTIHDRGGSAHRTYGKM